MYCEKCRHLFEEDGICPYCKSDQIREVEDQDRVFLTAADPEALGFIRENFKKEKIELEIAERSRKTFDSPYVKEEFAPQSDLYVDWADYERAETVLAKTFEELREMEEMPKPKRLAVQIVSIILFIAAIAVVVFAADAIANFVKSLFTK